MKKHARGDNIRISYHVCDICGKKIEHDYTTVCWKSGQDYELCEDCEKELYQLIVQLNKSKRGVKNE